MIDGEKKDEWIVNKIPHNVSQVLHHQTRTVKTAWIQIQTSLIELELTPTLDYVLLSAVKALH